MTKGELFISNNTKPFNSSKSYLYVHSCGQVQGLKASIENEQSGDFYYVTFIAFGEYIFGGAGDNDLMPADTGTLIIFPPYSNIYIKPSHQTSSRFWIKVGGSAFHHVLIDCGLIERKWFKSIYSKKTENNFLKIVSEMQMNNLCRQTKCNALLLDFITEIVRQPSDNSSSVKYANKKLIPALNIIHKDFAKDLSIDMLADACFLNKSYFIRLFKSNIGTTPHAYINKIRINHAKQYLLDIPNESISQIAYSVGFNDSAHFRKLFSSEVGMSPNQYRNSLI